MLCLLRTEWKRLKKQKPPRYELRVTDLNSQVEIQKHFLSELQLHM